MTAEKIINALLECWADQHEVELKGVEIIEKETGCNVDERVNASISLASVS